MFAKERTNTQDTTKAYKSNVFVYPYAFYSPETQLAFGVNNSISEIDFKQSKFSYRFGLRYQFDKEHKVNLRMDAGFVKETSGVYFGIEEAF